MRAHSFEIGTFLGASYGIDDFRVMGGGNVSYGLTKYLLPYVEYSYFPGIQRTQTNTVQSGITSVRVDNVYTLNLHDFHGGVHIRIPLRESKLVPYGVFGLGAILKGDEPYKSIFFTTPQTTSTGVSPGSKSFAVNVGGGLRYYINQKWGVRAEAKMYKPTGSAFNEIFGKVEFGVFLQLH